MVEEWDVASNTWLNKLYRLREKWCPVFSRDTFSAGIRSTQRSESTNNVFQQMACKTISLTEFVIQYEEQTTKMREVELQDDFSCAQGKPKIRVRGNGILHHASILYTHVIFRMFEDEFLQGISERLINSTSDGTLSSYTLQSESGQREHVVRFNSLDNNIICSCKLFESKGWLCRHALRIFNIQMNLREVPSQYVLKRWTKGAKEDIVTDEIGLMIPKVMKSSKIVHLNKLMRKCFNVMSLCSDDDETVNLAYSCLDRLAERAKKCKRGLDTTKSGNDGDNENPYFDNDEVVKDPIRKRSKGMSYGRLKCAVEKRKRKPTKEGTLKKLSPTIVVTSGPSEIHDIPQLTPNIVSPMSPIFDEILGAYNMSFTDMLTQNYLSKDSTEVVSEFSRMVVRRLTASRVYIYLVFVWEN